MVTPAGHEVQSRSSNDIFREHAELIPALSTLPPQKIHDYRGMAGTIMLK
jgi:hypothetical protein